jgi:hypothetical protein
MIDTVQQVESFRWKLQLYLPQITVPSIPKVLYNDPQIKFTEIYQWNRLWIVFSLYIHKK